MKHQHKLIKKSVFFQGQTLRIVYCKYRITKNCNYIREVNPIDEFEEKTQVFHTYQGDVTVKSRVSKNGQQIEILNQNDENKFIFKTEKYKFNADKKQLWLSVIRMMKRAVKVMDVEEIDTTMDEGFRMIRKLKKSDKQL